MNEFSEITKEPGDLIPHRILLLIIGLIAVIYFRSWGLVAYIVFTVIYCRILANVNGVDIILFGARDSPPGNIYASFLIRSFSLSLIGALISYSFADQFAVIASSWDDMNILGLRPNCIQNDKFYRGHFFNCNTLSWWFSGLSLLFPLVVAFTLTDVVKMAQLRIRIGKWMLLVIILVLAILTLPFIFSITLTGSHYGYMLRVSLLHISLLLCPFLSTRFSF